MKHLSLFIFLCLVIGCQQSGLPVQPVSGTVTYRGVPLADAVIGFCPKDSSGYTAAGITEQDGTFTLNIAGAGANGAVAGEYDVVVTKEIAVDNAGRPIPESVELESRPKMKSVIPAKYGKAGSTPLTATVVKGKNRFSFELTD
jgi:hypothetical protein